MKHASRWLIVTLAVLVTLLGWAATAEAHAGLLQADPTAGSVLHDSPSDITLTFTEAVDLVDDSLRLFRVDGTTVPLGQLEQPLGPTSIGATITDELPNGSYVVAWAAVSADSHPISGAYTFAVGETTPGVDVLVADLLNQQTDNSTSRWLTLGRYGSYLGIAVLIGTITAAVALAPWLLDGKRTGLVAQIGGLIGITATIVMISAQAATIGGGVDDWDPIIHIQSGRWWLIRLVAITILTVAVLERRLLDRPAVRAVAALTAIGLLAVVAAGGHAAGGDATTVALIATLVHLVAMTLWIGGLCLLVFVVEPQNRGEVGARFSPLALGSVIALAATGAINSWRQLDGIASLTDTSYGRWLLVKLGIVAAVIAVAAVVRRRARRAISPIPANDVDTTEIERTRGQRRLFHALVVEAVGIAVVLAATAGLTGATPPASDGIGTTATATVVTDGRAAQIELTPPVAGGTTMHVTINALTGGFDRADDITVSATLPERQLGPIDLPVYPAGPNHVTSDDANLPLSGRWTITVTARYGDFDQTVFVTDLDVKERP